MSIPQNVTFTCPKCLQTYEGVIWGSINTDLSDDLPQKIICGDFFDSKCPHCGFVGHLEYDLLYNDMKHNAWIWVVNKNSGKYSEKIEDIRRSSLLLIKSCPNLTFRIVNNTNQLREKVSALEAGRDDRVIELLKILATTTITNNNPGFYPSRIFYTFQGGKEMLRCYNVEGQELQAFLSDEHYQIVKKGFWNKISHLDDFYPPIFDAEWANRFIESE